ncbi:MAG: BLUF domain-containing protein [Calditrichia bacterium]|nr:BLUF domain-containing protein [Calditrichota bacterium]MCB0267487.1 BLUF domain-containing protein [Calditrichota bacterium]
MALVQLLYTSKISGKIGMADLTQIKDAAANHNPPLGISGMLCFGEGYFLQVLEGDAVIVNKHYQRISADPRHTDLVLLDYSHITKRNFHNWHMGHFNLNQLKEGLILKYATVAHFQPEKMHPQSALEFLIELSKYLENEH